MSVVKPIAGVMIKELIRKKDFYVFLIFLVLIMGLLASQSFFNIEGISRYIRDLGYSLVTLFSVLITVVFMAKQIPAELEAKTVYPLLAKPVSRFGVIAGKYAGGVSISVIAFSVFFGAYSLFYVTGGEAIRPLLLFQAYLTGIMSLSLLAALVMFFSNFLTLSANVTLSLITYFGVNAFSGVIRETVMNAHGVKGIAAGFLYYLIPHFDLFDMRVRVAHDWDALAFWVVGALAVYAIVYSGLLLFLSGAVFRRKRL